MPQAEQNGAFPAHAIRGGVAATAGAAVERNRRLVLLPEPASPAAVARCLQSKSGVLSPIVLTSKRRAEVDGLDGVSMSGLPSAGGGYGARHHHHHYHHHHHQHLGLPDVVSEFLAPTAANTGANNNNNNNKRKRRPAGTPDPDAEVVALSPKTLMESDRYVCEICNQGFQRDQNLQMHRRRHKVPWKLLKKPSTLGTNKRVYICPERSCLHHDPTHALGDLVGIKKHYRRKHCTEKQWKCVKCSKRYAVQSDYKAHLKTCGTRGHCCECGRVFSRVESFIEHQDTCGAAKHKHSWGAARERKPAVQLPHHQDVVTDRISLDSRSQSSDTTQALPFAQSGTSNTTAGARSTDSSHAQQPATVEDVDMHHSQRVIMLEAQQPAYNNAAAALPAWLMDLRGNKLELQLQSSLANSDFPTVRRVVVGDHGVYNNSAVCLTESKPATTTLPEILNTPSLSLSIGRTGPVDQATPASIESMPCLRLSIGPSTAEKAASSCPSQYADTKPATAACFGSRESLIALTTTPTLDTQAASLHDFLAQAWRPSAMQGCGSR